MSQRHRALVVVRGCSQVSQAQRMSGQRTGRIIGESPDTSWFALET
jgi:hypothetical protein